MKEKLNQIRMSKQYSAGSALLSAAGCLAAGTALGVFSKWLDNLALESSIYWYRWIEALDLGNFFSDIAIWLLIALLIAMFSPSALQAALRVFVFFTGMCIAYHLYTIAFSGFNPSVYMRIWYGITLLSPLLAMLCWYAKGTGTVSILLDTGIITAFFLSCFSIGLFYIDLKGILYLLVFCGAAATLYRDLKQFMISLPFGIIMAFFLNPLWPWH